jgi:hypothetical protein
LTFYLLRLHYWPAVVLWQLH